MSNHYKLAIHLDTEYTFLQMQKSFVRYLKHSKTLSLYDCNYFEGSKMTEIKYVRNLLGVNDILQRR